MLTAPLNSFIPWCPMKFLNPSTNTRIRLAGRVVMPVMGIGSDCDMGAGHLE